MNVQYQLLDSKDDSSNDIGTSKNKKPRESDYIYIIKQWLLRSHFLNKDNIKVKEAGKYLWVMLGSRWWVNMVNQGKVIRSWRVSKKVNKLHGRWNFWLSSKYFTRNAYLTFMAVSISLSTEGMLLTTSAYERFFLNPSARSFWPISIT